MNLLVLGGTIFVGRHLVEAAVSRGHSVTLFNRGRNHPDLFPDVEKLRGDRDGDLGALRGRSWDAAVDTCGYLPRVVRASADLLSGGVEHYTFISSCSVYPEGAVPDVDEESPVQAPPPQGIEDVAEHYGPLKVACEREVEAAMPGRALIIRPGLIVGPFDPSNRFTYWVRRIAAGGDVLAPGRPDREVQVIDARDLADWLVRLVESRRTGIYNAVGPAEPLTMAAMLEGCLPADGVDVRLTWVDEEFLLANGVEPWTEMPLWLPEGDPANDGFFKVRRDKAMAARLTYRPLEETARDTLAWEISRTGPSKVAPSGLALDAGMSPERERQLLDAWDARESGRVPLEG